MHPDPRTWRPQAFGRRKPKDLHDPIVEPAWNGVRVLAHVDGGGARLVDAAGDDLAGAHPEVVAALVAALRADSLVVDGYLTDQARESGEGVALDLYEAPGMGEHMAQFFLGKKGADMVAGRGTVPGGTTGRTVSQVEAAVKAGPATISFVAVDLLALDDDPLLDVPLLERKRLLESSLAESNRVRRTPFVREPAGSFIITWRSAGFGGLAYKTANSRYRPGNPNDDWSLIDMPRR
jgi:bifunctional non-homologous end joining protein LigD